ncbi:MAG: LysR family transcriptional regulator, partial [Pseudomonadota bacterium]
LENSCRTHAIALERTVTMATFPLMYEAVLQGIGVAVFLCNSSLIKNSVKEIPIREMPQKHETHLIATKDRVGLKLISEFINSVN